MDHLHRVGSYVELIMRSLMQSHRQRCEHSKRLVCTSVLCAMLSSPGSAEGCQPAESAGQRTEHLQEGIQIVQKAMLLCT